MYVKINTKKGTKMEDYTLKQLEALLKLKYLQQHSDGVTNLMYDDWVDQLDEKIATPTIEEYLYERQR